MRHGAVGQYAGRYSRRLASHNTIALKLGVRPRTVKDILARYIRDNFVLHKDTHAYLKRFDRTQRRLRVTP